MLVCGIVAEWFRTGDIPGAQSITLVAYVQEGRNFTPSFTPPFSSASGLLNIARIFVWNVFF